MNISAVICTRNREKYLRKAIRSLTEQDMSPGLYEIVVVDNRSTDETRQIVTEFQTRIPNLRYSYADQPGLANARNQGLEEAVAPIVAFLDDDAIAAPGWLAAIVSAFDTKPQPVCVGGPVEPWWEVPQPGWFPVSLVGCHNRFYGATSRNYDYPAEHPIGCNMAFLKEPVRQIGGFNAQLQKYNDETELISRLVKQGGRIFYTPRATVQHLVAKERLRLGWQIRRHYQEGKSLADVAALEPRTPRIHRANEVGRNLLRITRRSVRLVISQASIHERVQRLAELSTLVGKTVHLTKQLREE